MSSVTRKELEYPSSDGQPMAETPIHVRAIMLLHQALEDFFAGRTDVFVASDIFWYYQEGDTKARISPDVMVAIGVPPRSLRDRRSFFTWKEDGVIPTAVFEMASKKTWKSNLGTKLDKYRELGVKEYYLFDPEEVYLSPPLQVFHLHGKAYRRPKPSHGMYESKLGFKLRAEGDMLRLIDGKTGEPILTRSERTDAEIQRADAEAHRADAEAHRADAESHRADALAQEVKRLKAMLRQHGLSNGNGAKP